MRLAVSNKKKCASEKRSRASVRSNQTAFKCYGMSPPDVDFCNKQVKLSKSSFVIRWGNLGVHRILAPVGLVFAMYDKSVKRITFFIPRTTGLSIAKWARNLPKGRKSKKVMLLPELEGEASDLPVVNNGSDLADEDTNTVTNAQARDRRARLRQRVAHMQDRVDHFIEMGPQSNWEMISSLGDQIEQLEAQIESIPYVAELPARAPDSDRVVQVMIDHADPDHARRLEILETLGEVETDLYTCALGDLCDKADRLEKLKGELFCLIPNGETVDRREALHQATARLVEEIAQFQQTRSYNAGPHLTYDRDVSKGLRARLRVLSSMHRALFGTSYFMDSGEDGPEAQASTEMGDIIDIIDRPSIHERRIELKVKQAGLRKDINGAPVEDLTLIYFDLDKTHRGLCVLPDDEAEDGWDNQARDKSQLEREIEVLTDHLEWTKIHFDSTNIEVQDQRLADFEKLAQLVERHRSQFPKKEESHDEPHQTGSIQR